MAKIRMALAVGMIGLLIVVLVMVVIAEINRGRETQ